MYSPSIPDIQDVKIEELKDKVEKLEDAVEVLQQQMKELRERYGH